MLVWVEKHLPQEVNVYGYDAEQPTKIQEGTCI